MLTGKYVSLRGIEPSDSDSYLHWMQDEETNFWRGFHRVLSHDEASNWVKSEAQQSSEKLSLSILNKEGSHVGFIGLRSICLRSRRAELWIYIGAKAEWNKGVGTDAIKTLVSYAFRELNFNRIWLECSPHHSAAVKVYQKIGFVLEGTLKQSYFQRGEYRDSCIMGLLKDFWGKQP